MQTVRHLKTALIWLRGIAMELKEKVLGENNEMGCKIQRAQRNFRLFQDVTRSSYLY